MGKKKNGIWSSAYEHGPFYQGEGFTPFSDEIITRSYTKLLPPGEFGALLILNRFAWKNKKLHFEVSATFLAKFGIPLRTAERFLSPRGRLRQLEFIRLLSPDRARINYFFIEPVFIWSSAWDQMEFIEQSRLMQLLPAFEDRQNGGIGDTSGKELGTNDRQNGGTVDNENSTPAKMAGQNRQNGGGSDSTLATSDRQDGGDPKSDLFRYKVAPSHFRPGGNKRKNSSKKGVRLSANEHERNHKANLAAFKAQAAKEALDQEERF